MPNMSQGQVDVRLLLDQWCRDCDKEVEVCARDWRLLRERIEQALAEAERRVWAEAYQVMVDYRVLACDEFFRQWHAHSPREYFERQAQPPVEEGKE